MGLPFATTTVALARVDPTADPYGDSELVASTGPGYSTVATGVGCALVSARPRGDLSGAETRDAQDWNMMFDPAAPVRLADLATDEATGLVWRIRTVAARRGPDRGTVDHITCSVVRVAGETGASG